MLHKMMDKKEKMPENKKAAKMSILKALHDEMTGMMGDELKNVQKATVVAKDKKGLLEGLEKAQEVVEQAKPAEEEMHEEELTAEDIDAQIKALEEKKRQLTEK